MIPIRMTEYPDIETPLPAVLRGKLRTEVFGRYHIEFLAKTGSTNAVAIGLAERGAAEGVIVIADVQASGRGQMGRGWHSPGGVGVYLSIIVRPPFPPREAPAINLIASIAVAESLPGVEPGAITIKWPNDVLINGRKVSGILSEMRVNDDRIDFGIVGIGINVNNAVGSFPSEISATATSIFIETGTPANRSAVVRSVLESFERHYRTMISSGAGPILKRWESLSGFMGRRIRSVDPGAVITGVASGMDLNGHLKITDEEGREHILVSGDIEVIGD
ncbi:MAG TPA: biotin--[acetyl-CoA-carboxylase] ligase [Spirochaetota bacterium]|nr:biotin--[acetyl-CoA-carboxylase] ligase [Spirochaetota bacterium]